MIEALSGLGSLPALNGLDDKLSTTGAAKTSEADATSFASAMQSAAGSVVDDLKGAEAMSYKGITGDATTREVVDAVMTANRSLQTAVAIRDKVISAYLEISKMPI